ncbi:MAG: TIGR04255 family protein [Planctomycetota bacterium]|jgi:uncharacterized protein (TIGR04255 family)
MAKNKEEQVVKKFELAEVYPNQPLIEVVCEARFPADMAIECRKDLFHAKIKNKYSEILVPKVQVGKVMPFEVYRFEKKDCSVGIMLAINKFSFYEKKYKGHKKFIREFMRLARLLGETYSISKINRLGWRYINLIPFTREDGVVPLQRFLTVSLNVPNGMSERFENLSMVFISKVTGGSITTKIESVMRGDQQQEALVLDFDFAMTGNLNFSKLGDYIKTAHEHTRALFESLITDQYRQYLRGTTL